MANSFFEYVNIPCAARSSTCQAASGPALGVVANDRGPKAFGNDRTAADALLPPCPTITVRRTADEFKTSFDFGAKTAASVTLIGAYFAPAPGVAVGGCSAGGSEALGKVYCNKGAT